MSQRTCHRLGTPTWRRLVVGWSRPVFYDTALYDTLFYDTVSLMVADGS